MFLYIKRPHNMKHFTTLIVLFVLASTVVACSGTGDKEDVKVETPDTIPVLVQQMQQCSRLYTAECRVRKIVTHDDEVQLRGKALGKDFSINLPVGKRKVAIPVTATLKAYVDMSAIKPEDIRRDGDRIEVMMPKPHVMLTSTRIDHKEVKQYVALLRSDFTDEELTAYQSQGRKAIINDVPTSGLLDMARQSAARQLIPLIAQMGFKKENITITFSEDIKNRNTIAWVLD